MPSSPAPPSSRSFRPLIDQEASHAAQAAPLIDEAALGPLAPLVRGFRWTKTQLKDLWHRYGWLTVATYFGVYVTTLTTLFALRRAKVIRGMEPADVQTWVNSLTIKQRLIERPVTLSPVIVDFAIAWLLVKPTEPLRALATVFLVPFLARRLPVAVLQTLGVHIARTATATAAAGATASASIVSARH